MLIVNPLGIKANLISSILGQAIGFMFHFPTKKAKIFAFSKEHHASIHMLFVFFPLIVVWLDKSKKVTHFNVLQPFVSFSGHKAKYVMEIPYSPEVLKKIKLNQKLSW